MPPRSAPGPRARASCRSPAGGRDSRKPAGAPAEETPCSSFTPIRACRPAGRPPCATPWRTRGWRCGAFRLRFEPRPPALAVIEWGARLRARWLGLPYGDQALFARRADLEAVGGLRPVPLFEDLDLVRALRRRGAWRWCRWTRSPRRAATSRAASRGPGCATPWRSPPGGSGGTASASRPGCGDERHGGPGARGRRSAADGPGGFRRLAGYLRHNRGTYVVGALVTLGYAAVFAAVPMLVAWAIRAVEQGLPPAEVWRRCGVLVAATSAAARSATGRARSCSTRRARSSTRSATTCSRTSSAAAVLLPALAHRRPDEPLRQRPQLGPADAGARRALVVQTPILYAGVIAAMFSLDPLLARWCCCRTRCSSGSRAPSGAPCTAATSTPRRGWRRWARTSSRRRSPASRW
jgi:hypothetical protein